LEKCVLKEEVLFCPVEGFKGLLRNGGKTILRDVTPHTTVFFVVTRMKDVA
jgi:hypothetical protein